MIYIHNSDMNFLNHSTASSNFLNASNATTTTTASSNNIPLQNMSYNTSHNIAANAACAVPPTSLALFKNKSVSVNTDKAKNAIYLANAASFFTNITNGFAALSTGNIQQELDFIQIPYK
jgi:hypothetical protein